MNFVLVSGGMVTTLINYGGRVGGRSESTACVRSWRGGSLHQKRDRLGDGESFNEYHLISLFGGYLAVLLTK